MVKLSAILPHQLTLWMCFSSLFRSCQASTPWLRCRSLTAPLGTCVKGSHSSLCSSSNIPVYRTVTKISRHLKCLAGQPGTCVRVSSLFSLSVQSGRKIQFQNALKFNSLWCNFKKHISNRRQHSVSVETCVMLFLWSDSKQRFWCESPSF